jgi:tetratricopeptide (TPR) repeat protein
MKRVVLVIMVIFSFVLAQSQDKTARDYKIEGADAYKEKDYKKALTSFEKAIGLYEADGIIDTTLYYNVGLCAIRLEDHEKSVTYFNRSIELGYRTCQAQLYVANSLRRLDRNEEMKSLAQDGVKKCPDLAGKFNELLFQYYLVAGLEIFNNAAKMQAEITPFATSDPDRYLSEMETVKAEFRRSLPLLESAHELDPKDENCKKALRQAYEILDMPSKAGAL